MSIIRSGVPREFSFTASSNEDFKLNELSSTEDSIQRGEDFAFAISQLSKGEYEPKKATYPKFKKTFWEEAHYNPSIANTQQRGYSNNAHSIEHTSHWKKKGHVMSLEKRFVEPPPPKLAGPKKSEQYPHFFEKGDVYFARTRELNPFATAKQYTKPLDRVNQETLKFIEEDKAKAGPGTYKPPDYWEKIVYGSVAEPIRPSAMMEIKEKRDIYMYYNIPDYVELKKQAKNRVIESPYHSQRGKMTSLLPTSKPRTECSRISMNINSSPRRKLEQAISKSRMRGAKFPDSKLDFNYRGVPHDTQFVRLKKENGEVFIGPMLISSDNPNDEIALKGTERLPLWGDISQKRDIYCVPSDSTIEIFSEDGSSPAAQQDVYTLPGENIELTVGKITLPGNKKHGNKPVTISARKQALNTTRPQTSPAVMCTPYLSNRSLLHSDIRKQKKFSSQNTPEVLSPNTLPLHMCEKITLKKEGPLSASRHCNSSDFKNITEKSQDIAEMFEPS